MTVRWQKRLNIFRTKKEKTNKKANKYTGFNLRVYSNNIKTGRNGTDCCTWKGPSFNGYLGQEMTSNFLCLQNKTTLI